MTTNPDVLRIAREIAAEQYPDGATYVHALTLTLREIAEKAAITAIERTAQLNADHLDDMEMPTCARTVRSHYALR